MYFKQAKHFYYQEFFYYENQVIPTLPSKTRKKILRLQEILIEVDKS